MAVYFKSIDYCSSKHWKKPSINLKDPSGSWGLTKDDPLPLVPQRQDILLHQVNDVVQPHPEGEALTGHVFLSEKKKQNIIYSNQTVSKYGLQ